MSHNINNEAVFPPAPALFSLRMAHHSPTRNCSKGTFELYDSKQRLVDTLKEKVQAADGIAPGSPDSVQDFKQIAVKLQKELEESKKKETDLQHLLTSMKNSPHSQNSFLEKQFIDASPSNDSVGENVKDAHIKHLQRQVTVLQATLYKSEGWINRVTDAVKERDKALDDVARLTNDIKEMQEDNHQLLRRIDSLGTALLEAQHSLRQVTDELQIQESNGQMVSQLREEILRQRNEIKALKDSVTRLDLENRSLKDSSVEGSCQSLGTVACSQELEHLHKVVDTLKNTVLEQRSYLLNLRQPSNSGNSKSTSLTSAFATNGVMMNTQELSRLSTSPKLRATDLCPADSQLRLQAVYGNSGHSMVLKSNVPIDSQMPPEVVYGLSDHSMVLKSTVPIDSQLGKQQVFQLASGGENSVALAKRTSSREMVEHSYEMNIPHSAVPASTQAGLIGIDSRLITQSSSPHTAPVRLQDMHSQSSPQVIINRSNCSYRTVNHNSQGQKPVPSMWNLRTVDEESANIFAPKMSPQHYQQKVSLPEVMAHRNMQATQDQIDPRLWHMRPWDLTSANNSASLATQGVSDHIDIFALTEPAAAQKQEPGHQAVQESLGQFIQNGSPVNMMQDQQKPENTNLNSTSKGQHIYYPPSSSENELRQAKFWERDVADDGMMMMKSPPPPPHPARSSASKEVMYINTSSSVDPDPASTRLLNSDRLCPVCSRDYTHLSMEDFQTHVFECFDDDAAAPETMKPDSSPDRSCPMCNASFGPLTPQSEFEKHVHEHFGESGPGEHFEIVQACSS